MLSTETSSFPSCSCKTSVLKSDEKTFVQVATKELNQVKSCLQSEELSKFCIRDYVFTARSKDIALNWPFSEKYLRICLKHGVNNVLPFFESPDSVRTFSRTIKTSFGLLKPESKDKENDDISLVLGPDDHSHLPLMVKPVFTVGDRQQIDRNLLNHAQMEKEINATGDPTSIEIEAFEETGKSFDSFGKKCKLMLKSDNNCNTSSTVSVLTSNTLTDIMVSNICPVCKLFSSISNTTMNAHMDRCLIIDTATSQKPVTKDVKSKVKPKRKRTMVEIYATAPPCTLEELDKRNGSTWAIDVCMTVPNSESSRESKRQKSSNVNVVDEKDETSECFKSNGAKFRDLSELNDAVMSKVQDEDVNSNSRKELKDQNHIHFNNKRSLTMKESKFLLKSSSNFDKNQSPGSKAQGTHEKEDDADNGNNCMPSKSHFSNSSEKVGTSMVGMLSQWVCSKRTRVSRKISNDNRNKGCLLYHNSMTKNSSVDCKQITDVNDSEYKNSSSSSPHTKKFGCFQYLPYTMDDRQELPLPGNNINLSENCQSSIIEEDRRKLKIPSGDRVSTSPNKEIEGLERFSNGGLISSNKHILYPSAKFQKVLHVNENISPEGMRNLTNKRNLKFQRPARKMSPSDGERSSHGFEIQECEAASFQDIELMKNHSRKNCNQNLIICESDSCQNSNSQICVSTAAAESKEPEIHNINCANLIKADNEDMMKANVVMGGYASSSEIHHDGFQTCIEACKVRSNFVSSVTMDKKELMDDVPLHGTLSSESSTVSRLDDVNTPLLSPVSASSVTSIEFPDVPEKLSVKETGNSGMLSTDCELPSASNEDRKILDGSVDYNTTRELSTKKSITVTDDHRFDSDSESRLVQIFMASSTNSSTEQETLHPILGCNILTSSGSYSRVFSQHTTSNPVLRLMGKNLMVLNPENDENYHSKSSSVTLYLNPPSTPCPSAVSHSVNGVSNVSRNDGSNLIVHSIQQQSFITYEDNRSDKLCHSSLQSDSNIQQLQAIHGISNRNPIFHHAPCADNRINAVIVIDDSSEFKM